MTRLPFDGWPAVQLLVRIALGFAATMLAAVIVERLLFARRAWYRRRLEQRYEATVRRALDGDDEAVRTLVASPLRHRLALAWMLMRPLIENRDTARIDRTRDIAEALSLVALADRYLRSRLWWRRALALRALGLARVKNRTAAIVAALDDPNEGVRAAALDSLTDLLDPASLQAVIVRMHDASLHRGRRAAALTAFGRQCEPFVLELGAVDARHRVSYARVLAVCGTGQSRPMLKEWAAAGDTQVRAAAFEALAHIGLDEEAAQLAFDGLENEDASVRAMAAHALGRWTAPGDTASRLAAKLNDTWTVAVRAAQSLRSLGPDGVTALRAAAGRPDLAGVLARQMLWEERAGH